MMIHDLNLHPGPFELIKNGHKDIEMRLYDDRRKDIKIGDQIRFTNNVTGEKLLANVINLYLFKDFDELYNYFPKERLGYLPDETAKASDMEIYYSIEKIHQFGVVGIQIELV